MKIIGSVLLAMSITLVGSAQNSPADKPVPPALNDPGVQHPLPLPKQTPDPVQPNVRQPDVRQPVHEGGRERAVSGKSRQSSGTKSNTKSKTTEQSASDKAQASQK